MADAGGMSMKRRALEILGLFSGTCTTSSFVPQVISLWRHAPKPASDIPVLMYIVLNIGVLGWLIYGLLTKSRPVWIANAVTLVLAVSILVYKCIYG